jgi:hypothetical protein
MKIYTWFFVLITLAQLVFTITWFLFVKRLDRIIILSSLIYAAVMIIGYITYEIEKYRNKKKELIDNLPND